MCSVVGCDSSRNSAQRFKLPEEPEKRLEWMEFLAHVNGQRFKESSWTDINICSNHFTYDCFENLSQLKSTAVPSLNFKSEFDEGETKVNSVQSTYDVKTTEVACQCDPLQTCDISTLCLEESGEFSQPSQTSHDRVPSSADVSNAVKSGCGQMRETPAAIAMSREKAFFLQASRTYVVNKTCLLNLLPRKCPSCRSKLQVELTTNGVLIVLNQQCLQCQYRNEWKSQVKARASAAEDECQTEDTDAVPQNPQKISSDVTDSGATAVSEIITLSSEESDHPDDDQVESNETASSSEEEWKPSEEVLLENELMDEEFDSATEDEDEMSDSPLEHKRLCAECGTFYNVQRPHTCTHKAKPYACNICGGRFASEPALGLHARIHDENYNHQCKYCHVAFKTKVDKSAHEQTHKDSDKPYQCPHCSETFATYKKRIIHQDSHRSRKMLNCPVCGREFLRTRIKRHLLMHTGAKPFQCSVCQRGFNQRGHLKSHMRLHTGERPFKCKYCEKCFNHNVSLKAHVQRYHTSSSANEQKAVGDHESGLKSAKDRRSTKSRGKSTGRPIGRPKRSNQAQAEGKGSNTKPARLKVQSLKARSYSDEESEEEEDQQTDSDSAEEKEEPMRKGTGRSRKRSYNVHSDSDFDPDEEMKRNRTNHGRRPKKCPLI